MGKKFLYNIFLNIGIIVLAYCTVAAYNGKQYSIMAGSILGIAALIYLKIKLAKSVKEMIKTGNK
ncbi:DUF6358 family protein [Olivibacter sp. XZL3]|uniref:DUF6358 family protein n=1 Tax=Olivibacter sp. XZL3 TaxID=1735116 RepID=UPI0010660EFA|nr:DUF6358 family protein [Olivibacter sp. XZL3]